MSEETPMFKFKKATTKKIGDLDVLDSSEWTLLIKHQIQDVSLFIHFRKLWNLVEQPEQTDTDGNVIQEAVETQPAYEFRSGFIKEDKFITQSTKMVSEKTYHAINKRYISNLKNFIDQGYQKDFNNYNGDEPIVPHYFINEKVSEEDQLAKFAQQAAAARQAQFSSPNMGLAQGQAQVPDPNGVVPMSVALTSVPAPKTKSGPLKMFTLKKKAIADNSGGMGNTW